jgi:hypothetical protein
MTSSTLRRTLSIHIVTVVALGLLNGFNCLATTAAEREGSYTVETFRVGSAPFGLAFDGANIWVANGGSDTVTKLRASDGNLIASYKSGGRDTEGVVFDGASIWVSNYVNSSVSKITLQTP